jgi:4'-phosphopantetheinyl transferase
VKNGSRQFSIDAGQFRLGSVDTWLVEVGAIDRMCTEFEILSNDERARAARFVFQRDRVRYVAAHTALRHVLAVYTGEEARAIAFNTSVQGKPSVADPTSALSFNLSHSGNYALIATTAGPAVGVDIEEIRTRLHTEEISATCFVSDERAWLDSLAGEARLHGFFRLWTAKEALLKAIGTGLRTSPLRFVATFLPDSRISFASATDRRSIPWIGYELNIVRGYAACVVIEAGHAVKGPGNVTVRYFLPPSKR